MTSLTDPQKDRFRLSMLLYDTRYRSATIQIIALIFFMLVAAWLISNTAQNLAALGKPIDLGFLTEPASNNARFYLESARALAPRDPAVTRLADQIVSRGKRRPQERARLHRLFIDLDIRCDPIGLPIRFGQ